MNAAGEIQKRRQKEYGDRYGFPSLRKDLNEDPVQSNGTKKNKKVIKKGIDKVIAITQHVKKRQQLNNDVAF